MKKQYLVAIPVFVILALASAGAAMAYDGGGGRMFLQDPAVSTARWESDINNKAGILGITADEMKNYWSQGKNISEIAKEKGISADDLKAKMQATKLAQQKEWLQTLVTEGKITQAQADARLKFMSERQAKAGNMKGGHRGRAPMGVGFGLKKQAASSTNEQ